MMRQGRSRPFAESGALDYWMWRNNVSGLELANRVKYFDPKGVGCSERTIRYYRHYEKMAASGPTHRAPVDGSLKLALLICAATNWEVQVHQLVSAAWLSRVDNRRRVWHANVTRGRRSPPNSKRGRPDAG